MGLCDFLYDRQAEAGARVLHLDRQLCLGRIARVLGRKIGDVATDDLLLMGLEIDEYSDSTGVISDMWT